MGDGMGMGRIGVEDEIEADAEKGEERIEAGRAVAGASPAAGWS